MDSEKSIDVDHDEKIARLLSRATMAYTAQIAADTVKATTNNIWTKEELALEMADTLRDYRSLVESVFEQLGKENNNPLGVRDFFTRLYFEHLKELGFQEYHDEESGLRLWLMPAHLFYVLKGAYPGMYVTGIDAHEHRLSDTSEQIKDGLCGYVFQ